MVNKDGPSPIARKILAASQNPPELIELDTRPPFRKTLYFSCGTLVDPATLARVFQRTCPPEVRPIVTVGPRLKLWGKYPALPGGPGKEAMHGIASEIQSQKEADRLAAYETEMYALKGCPIYFDDGEDAGVVVFYWAGVESLLTEGTFDLKDWLLRKRECEIQTGN